MTSQSSDDENRSKTDSQPAPGLYSESRAFEIVIPDPSSRPSLRTVKRWRDRKLYPYVKVGAKILVDPEALRRALDRKFTVHAIEQ